MKVYTLNNKILVFFMLKYGCRVGLTGMAYMTLNKYQTRYLNGMNMRKKNRLVEYVFREDEDFYEDTTNKEPLPEVVW